MGKLSFRRKKVAKLVFREALPARRAVFLVAAQDRTDRQRLRELFQMIGKLADIRQLAEGEIMAYAVQTGSDADLFSKLEWVLKSQFSFCVIERSFSQSTYQLIESLCVDSESRLLDVPQCGICSEADPFPSRVIMNSERDEALVEACYCARCVASEAHPNPKKQMLALLRRDGRHAEVLPPTEEELVPARRTAPRTDTTPEREVVYAIAS